MKYKELKKKSSAELAKMLLESRDKLRDLRFKVATKQIKNVRELRAMKRTIAKILSLINVENKKSQNHENTKSQNYTK